MYVIHALNHTLATHAVMDPTVRSPTESPKLTLRIRLIDCLTLNAEKRRTWVILIAILATGTLTIHYAVRQQSRLSQIFSPHSAPLFLQVLKPVNTGFDESQISSYLV